MSKTATVRRAQLLSTYGIGGMFPSGSTSFMIMGLDEWVTTPRDELIEPRLARSLGIRKLFLPPSGRPKGDVPARRFPETQFCPGCHRVGNVFKDFRCGYKDVQCKLCSDQRELIPFRLMVACNRGHVDEFPLFEWLHKGTDRSGTEHKMSVNVSGTTSSLADMKISCTCGAPSIGLDGAFNPRTMQELGVRCHGRRPWLFSDDDECSENPRTVQRGASNVWFAAVQSAIAIPPYSMAIAKFVDGFAPDLADAYGRPWQEIIDDDDDPVDRQKAVEYLLKKAKSLNRPYTRAGIEGEIERRKTVNDTAEVSEHALRRDEYQALIDGSEDSADSDFVSLVREVPEGFGSLLSSVRKVTRLREVRALYGFSRLDAVSGPPGTDRLCALSQEKLDWLPAIEVSGEGVFLGLDVLRLANWASDPWVTSRAALLDEAQRIAALHYGRPTPAPVDITQVALHTFAHVIIDQFALDSGYPASSLRERLYVDETMAGILIYTASSDSAGSLGGVAAQAEASRLGAALGEGIERLAWCSSDPVCIESTGAGTDSLNLAACHACVLVPETSCEHFNTLLDRALLFGTPEGPGVGKGLFNTI